MTQEQWPKVQLLDTGSPRGERNYHFVEVNGIEVFGSWKRQAAIDIRDRLVEALKAAPSPPRADATSSADYWQQRGYLGEPSEWQEACRLFRQRCNAHDCEQMARLRTYIEEGLLIVIRPNDAPKADAGWWRAISEAENMENGTEVLVSGYLYGDPDRGCFVCEGTMSNGSFVDAFGDVLYATHFMQKPLPPTNQSGVK